jgi:thiol-disulfide isomerase/thioredoxin
MRMLSGLLVLLVLVVAGCGTDTTTTSQPDPDIEVIGTGKTADLAFTATTLTRETFDGTDLAGKPAVLWFWAPWCPTCRAQIPTVSGIGEEYAGRVNVVAVGGLDTQDEIEALAGRIDHVTHLVDDEGAVWKHFRVTAQSTYTVVDADGEIVSEGYLDDGAIEDLVAALAG